MVYFIRSFDNIYELIHYIMIITQQVNRYVSKYAGANEVFIFKTTTLRNFTHYPNAFP